MFLPTSKAEFFLHRNLPLSSLADYLYSFHAVSGATIATLFLGNLLREIHAQNGGHFYLKLAT